MSRPLGPPSTRAAITTNEALATNMSILTETRTFPALTAPSFHDGSRQLPIRIQLPPLEIPSAPNRTEYMPSSAQSALSDHRRASTTQILPFDCPSHARTPLNSRFSPRFIDSSAPGPSHSPSPFRRASDVEGLAARSKHEVEEHYHQQDQVFNSPYRAAKEQHGPFHRSAIPTWESARSQFRPTQQYSHSILPPPPPQLPSVSSISIRASDEVAPVAPSCRDTPLVPTPSNSCHVSPYYQPQQSPRSQHVSHRLEELRYELRVRQQPIAARACGFGERDRRVIDPPPIIQLTVSDVHTRQVDLDELRYSLNVVHCTLWSADGRHEETALVQPDRRATRRLMGQLVASPSVAKDEHDQEGCFFCFPDLSCRTHGRYRLRFVLMRIDPANLVVGGTSPILTEVLSDVFTVYTAKDFPGMRPSSALTRALKLQGCNIQVKKGNEKMFPRKRSAVGMDDVGADDGRVKRLHN